MGLAVDTKFELNRQTGACQGGERHAHVFEILARSAMSAPDKEALVYDQERFSYRDLLERAAAVAEQLSRSGVGCGAKVGVLFPNHPDYVASFFAVAALGATIVPINPLLKSEEIAHILSDSGARTLIVHEQALAEALQSQQQHCCLTTIFTTQEEPAPHKTIKIETLTREKANPDSLLRSAPANIKDENQLALLVYTSGTTGKPKGAMLSHKNVLAVFPGRLDIIGLHDNDRTLAVLPMCHIYGITVLMIGTISRAATIIILQKFEAPAALSAIAAERVTIVPAVPTMHHFMVLELQKTNHDTTSVRLSMSGGAAMDRNLIPQIEKAFPNTVVLEGYALTETACAATLNPLTGIRKAGSVGPALPGVSIEIRDSEGKSLPAGESNVGELCVKGANVMSGYYNQPQASAETIVDGWMLTGDLSWMDDDGYLYIVGRKKELIIRGGQNIYPKEIEDVISRIPEVLEAAVIGVPDQFMGERVKAVVVLRANMQLSEQAVKDFCTERLAEYKVPRLVEFRGSLPRNSTGKVLKRMLCTT